MQLNVVLNGEDQEEMEPAVEAFFQDQQTHLPESRITKGLLSPVI